MAKKQTKQNRKPAPRTKPKARVVASKKRDPSKRRVRTIPIGHVLEVNFKPVITDVTGLERFKRKNARYQADREALERHIRDVEESNRRRVQEEHDRILARARHRRDLIRTGHVYQGTRRDVGLPAGSGARKLPEKAGRKRMTDEERRQKDRERKQKRAAARVAEDFALQEEMMERQEIITKLQEANHGLDYSAAWQYAYQIQQGELTFNQAIKDMDK